MNKKQFLIISALLFLIGFSAILFAQESGPADAGWEVERRGDKTFYFSHGTAAWGNEFGFIKEGDCRMDTLWLTFSFSDERVRNFEGQDVMILLRVDGRDFKVKLPVWDIGGNGFSKTMKFTNWNPSKQLMDALIKGSYVQVRIVGPKDLEEMLDIKEDQFSLKVFAATRREAEEICKNQSSGMDWIK